MDTTTDLLGDHAHKTTGARRAANDHTKEISPDR